MKFPFVFIGRPFLTLCEHKKHAWSGEPKRYHVTCPVETRKQWKPVVKFKRKAS